MVSSDSIPNVSEPQTRERLQIESQTRTSTTNQASRPSSSTEGFFQTPPLVQNQFFDDTNLQRVVDLFLPSTVASDVESELSAFGDTVLSKRVLNWVADAEKNPPYLRTWDSWGRRKDDLVTSEGWRSLQDLGIEEGMVAIPYENKHAQHSRVHFCTKYYLWVGSSAWVNCPSLMVDGIASLFRQHLSDPDLPTTQRAVLQSAFDRLTSRDPSFAWTTGQWMTERIGGSDVSQTETLATYSPYTSSRNDPKASDGQPLGPWLVNGFKWFSSATDASMTVLLARTENGVSTFFAPMRRTIIAQGNGSTGTDTELNGISIQRLKQKLGTRALPTAELELNGVRAYLVGEEGRGTKQIATVLNIARIHNAITSVGLWGRGLAVSRAFAKCRKVGQEPLHRKPGHVRTLAKMHVEHRANMLFTFFVCALLGMVEQSQQAAYQRKPEGTLEPTSTVPHPSTAEHLLRLLTPAVKGVTAKTAVVGLGECMETLGGVGYLENEEMMFNIARLTRDANVCNIWEGTTDMMALDVLRVVYGKTSSQVIETVELWLEALLEGGKILVEESRVVAAWWHSWKNVIDISHREETEMRAREMMIKLGDIIMGTLLIVDARRDGNPVSREAAEIWFADRRGGDAGVAATGDWMERAKRDRRVVFGEASLEEPGARL